MKSSADWAVIAPLAGAIVLGFTNSAVGNIYGATFSTLVGMLVLLVLFVRPSGLMGRKFYDE